MAVNFKSDEGLAIRKLVPLTTLPARDFEALCADMTVETAGSGTVLFHQGDTTKEYFYLLDGAVCLQAQDLVVETIKADSQSARFAIAHQNPRKIDAIAVNDIRYLRINLELLEQKEAAPLEEESEHMLDEIDENSDDWMTTLLKSPIFQRLPAANLQKILIEMEDVVYKKGDVLVQQGDSGDYYFVIKSGQCMLTRKPSPNAREIKLAQLHEHDTFGEDSLISGAKRNVTVTALTEMSLLRIDKEKFLSLIKEPALRYIDYQSMRQDNDEHALLLDVRSVDEYKQGFLEGSINAPFFSLRMQLKTFHRKRKIYVVCADGKISEAAAFLMIRNKFDAIILQGGMQSVPKEEIRNTASFNIDTKEDLPEVAEGKLDAEPSSPVNWGNIKEILASGQEPWEQNIGEQELRELCRKLKAEFDALLQEKQSLQQQSRLLYNQNEKLKLMLQKQGENS